MADLAKLYDLEVSDEDSSLTVAAYFARHLKVPPQPGGRLPGGAATLHIRTVEDGAGSRAGLQLGELVDTLVATALARRPALDLSGGPRRLFDRAHGLVAWPRRRSRTDTTDAPPPDRSSGG